MSGVARSRRDRERLRVSGGRGRHGHDDCRVPASPLPGPVHSPVCPSSCTTPSCCLTSVSYKPKGLWPPISCTTLEVHGLRQVGCSHEVAGRAIIKDRKSTRLNSSHVAICYAVFCLKKITE